MEGEYTTDIQCDIKILMNDALMSEPSLNKKTF